MKCIWCNGDRAEETLKNCQWRQDDGSGVIVIKDIPAIHCPDCHDTYLAEEIYEEVEIAINTVNLNALGNEIPYSMLMNAPRLSIFDMIKRGDSFGCAH